METALDTLAADLVRLDRRSTRSNLAMADLEAARLLLIGLLNEAA